MVSVYMLTGSAVEKDGSQGATCVLWLAPASAPLQHVRWLRSVARTWQTKPYLLTYSCLCEHSRNSNDGVFLIRPSRKQLNLELLLLLGLSQALIFKV